MLNGEYKQSVYYGTIKVTIAVPKETHDEVLKRLSGQTRHTWILNAIKEKIAREKIEEG